MDSAEGSPATGRLIEIDWHDQRVAAWQPESLDRRDLTISMATARKTERAMAAIGVADRDLPASWEALARLLLRAEGIASSSIEGLRVPLTALASAEATGEPTGDAAWVSRNLSVVETAIAQAKLPLHIDRLHEWHRTLMSHSRLPDGMVGDFRSAPSWLGGTSPLDAVYVPPPPDQLPALMADLVDFCNGTSVDPITQAAVVHAQFETIHPYGDGNGRIGRVLIGWILRRRDTTAALPPPISVLIARDPGGYLAGLHRFRHEPIDGWVNWFADITERAARATSAMVVAVEELLTEWRERTTVLRSDSSAHGVLGRLPAQPVVSALQVAAWEGVSERAGRDALAALETLEILHPYDSVVEPGRGRSRRWWIATELIELARAWS